MECKQLTGGAINDLPEEEMQKVYPLKVLELRRFEIAVEACT